MRARDVELGAIYVVAVSRIEVPVKITAESPYGGWVGVNLRTNRVVRIRSAQRLRHRVKFNPRVGRWVRVKETAK